MRRSRVQLVPGPVLDEPWLLPSGSNCKNTFPQLFPSSIFLHSCPAKLGEWELSHTGSASFYADLSLCLHCAVETALDKAVRWGLCGFDFPVLLVLIQHLIFLRFLPPYPLALKFSLLSAGKLPLWVLLPACLFSVFGVRELWGKGR